MEDKEGTFLIGREAGDILLDDDTVSAEHAELVIVNGDFYVYDLSSTNGTYRVTANGDEELTGAPLQPSDRLVFGGLEVSVEELLRELARRFGVNILTDRGVDPKVALGFAGGTSGKPREKTGLRVICLNCGTVYLASLEYCSRCDTPRGEVHA